MDRLLRPGRRILGGRAVAMQYLSDRTGVVAVILEILWQRYHIRKRIPEMCFQVPNLNSVRP